MEIIYQLEFHLKYPGNDYRFDEKFDQIQYHNLDEIIFSIKEIQNKIFHC